jgi:hypothetical protein
MTTAIAAVLTAVVAAVLTAVVAVRKRSAWWCCCHERLGADRGELMATGRRRQTHQLVCKVLLQVW